MRKEYYQITDQASSYVLHKPGAAFAWVWIQLVSPQWQGTCQDDNWEHLDAVLGSRLNCINLYVPLNTGFPSTFPIYAGSGLFRSAAFCTYCTIRDCCLCGPRPHQIRTAIAGANHLRIIYSLLYWVGWHCQHLAGGFLNCASIYFPAGIHRWPIRRIVASALPNELSGVPNSWFLQASLLLWDSVTRSTDVLCFICRGCCGVPVVDWPVLWIYSCAHAEYRSSLPGTIRASNSIEFFIGILMVL